MLRHKSNHMFYLKIIILISAVLNTTSKEDGYVIMCAFYEKKNTTTTENIYFSNKEIKVSQFSSTFLSPGVGLAHL